jgi:hypothetical protein
MDNKQIMAIYTDGEPGEACMTSQLRFMVGDQELEGVESVSFGVGGTLAAEQIVTATIVCAVRLGK